MKVCHVWFREAFYKADVNLAIATSEILQQEIVHLTSSSSTGLAATTDDFHGRLATSTGGIQLAAVSPFILAASSTCRHASDTAMQASGIGWGLHRKTDPT